MIGTEPLAAVAVGAAQFEAANGEKFIVENKTFRVALDVELQKLKESPRKSRERSIVITKLQEAIMWLGMDLKELAAPNPYPNSYNPSNAIVDKTSDGLKL